MITILIVLGLLAIILFLYWQQEKDSESYVSRKSIRGVVLGLLVGLSLLLAIFYPKIKDKLLEFQKKNQW